MHRSYRQGITNLGRSDGDSQQGEDGRRNRTMLQEENDRMTDNLGNKISALKSLTIDIGNEVRSQNKLLNEMDTDFDTSSGFLGSAMTRLKKIQGAGFNSVTWKLLAFAFVVFLVLYFVIRYK